MEAGGKRTQRDYKLAFKRSVVDQVEKGELTYKEVQRRYGIQGRSTVLVWLRKHGNWTRCLRSSINKAVLWFRSLDSDELQITYPDHVQLCVNESGTKSQLG